MKRFEILKFGLLVCIAGLPSCAHVEPLAQGRGSRVQSREQDHRPTPVISRHSTDSETGSQTARKNTDVTPSRDQPEVATELLPKLLPKLLQTSFEDNSQTPVPLLPVPDGENPAPQPDSLTLNDLKQIAQENNPTLQQLAAVVDKARGIRQQVGLYPNPVIAYSGQEMGDDGTAGQQGGFVSQTIVTGDKLRLNRAVAAWDIEGLSWEYQAQKSRVLNDIRLQFYAVLGAQRRVSMGKKLQKVGEDGVKTAQALFEAKQGARPDVLQAQLDLYPVRIILQNARYDYEAAWRQLASLLGQPELKPARLTGTLEEDPKEWDWESTYQRLLEASPELQVANTRIRRAQALIRRQEAQRIPNLLAQVGVAHDNASGDEVASVVLGIPLPLFNRNQGNIRAACAEYSRSVQDVNRLKLGLRNRLAVVFRDYQQADYQVERYTKDILLIARENLNLTEEGYKQGEFDFLRLLTARRTYYETSLRYVDSLIELRQAEVLLSGLLLTGGLDNVRNISPGADDGAGGLRGMALSGQ